jgi:hypothetical protein
MVFYIRITLEKGGRLVFTWTENMPADFSGSRRKLLLFLTLSYSSGINAVLQYVLRGFLCP